MCPQHDSPAARAPAVKTDTSVAPSATQHEPRLDAGTKDIDHYAQRLPEWRNDLRKRLIPIVRWETPYLALMQEKLRSPALDSYFAYTANLGTHTFYMIFLPILFWCGYTNIGRAMVHMLAAGIFWSGYLKDMVCLPRPLSPPLKRISMSGSAALEYGFPSSHSANALSVAVYAIHSLRASPDEAQKSFNLGLQVLFCFFAASIVFGRLYCGMHGFLDVVIGSIMGVVIAAFQLRFGDWFDLWITRDTSANLILAIVIMLILIRIHPEPADDCPCFDDTLSFMGVVMGCQIGAWHYTRTGLALDYPIPSTVPFDLSNIGVLRASIRILLGVFNVFAWRSVMKPALLKILPPIFRVLEQARLNLPRAFFLDASKYTKVPTLRGDDNVIPSASDLPHMLRNLAHPRKRSVSVGPQSAADAYETLAYRNRRRRESVNSQDGPLPEDAPWTPSNDDQNKSSAVPSLKNDAPMGANLLPTPLSSRVHSYERMMGNGDVEMTTVTPPEVDADIASGVTSPLQSPADEENERRVIFMMLQKPRVRYDVEVVTKLIVYAGIAWIAVEGNPLFFQLCGLGMSTR